MHNTLIVPVEDLLSSHLSKSALLSICRVNRKDPDFTNKIRIDLYHRSQNGCISEFVEFLDYDDPNLIDQLFDLVRDHPTPERWEIIANHIPMDRFTNDELREIAYRSRNFPVQNHIAKELERREPQVTEGFV